MFRFHLSEEQKERLQALNIRVILLIAAVVAISGGLIYRLFVLQIVNGESYLNNFQLRISRDVSIPGTRGNIYDRNGNVLAYNELSYSVTIRDMGESASSSHSLELNRTIGRAIDLIEASGDTVTASFNIDYNEDTDAFQFTVSGVTLNRFLADIYGHAKIEDLTAEERAKSADDVIYDLCKNYYIGQYTDPNNRASGFIPEYGYEKKRLLQLVSVRYLMGLNGYQQYVATTIASNVSDQTVAAILENASTMDGISIDDATMRVYTDSKYFAQILGYTGRISTEELSDLRSVDPTYESTDYVGKSGIEKTYEQQLQGTKGTKTIYVDSFGKELETTNVVEPTSGDDIYLTIDKDLQEAAYDILEKKLSSIILSKLVPDKLYDPGETPDSSKIVIPIYTVYYQMINNNIIDTKHFTAENASTVERQAKESFDTYLGDVMQQLSNQLDGSTVPYQNLSMEWQEYDSYIIQKLKNDGVIDMSRVDREDDTYVAWTTDEVISMSEFLHYCISQNWIDASMLDLSEEYVDSSEEYEALVRYMMNVLPQDEAFGKHIYHYLILNDILTGPQVCQILIQQGIVNVSQAEEAALIVGDESSYQFMANRIQNLDITPAQLALDPCTGSLVITDVNNGDVLALVSYPGYDNNKMANTVDAAYYDSLRNDLSNPLLNYATQQRTAPGSTFKMVSSTAGLMENAISMQTELTCTGVFHKIGNPEPHCWVYPNAHGTLDLIGAIQNSCNDFFYEVGYRLATDEDDKYDSDLGLAKLRKYAELYGLGTTSGIEIDEARPIISSTDSVRSAIGQGSANYTTVGLARYVTAVANSGTVYDLTLLGKITTSDGQVVQENSANVRNVLNMDDVYWNAIHEGMKHVVDGKLYFGNLPVTAAGKTGTAQESDARPNHALFVCYAPYEAPQIAVATRVAYGYASDYASQITEEVLEYYYGVSTVDEIVNDTQEISATDITAD